ncbi:PREDICTED: putative cytochrome c oxidase subunit 6b-like [Camelina sativa]|uniref:Cytochrome c oxidase subunit 6b-like n=1 Tax=Camelina sativa TaxID=90675 RepID=A0ABM0YJ46_CAMSA|nr:PREDICTED: putative cytochrome c oxidase subunit 6b-like [Camelina sativa]
MTWYRSSAIKTLLLKAKDEINSKTKPKIPQLVKFDRRCRRRKWIHTTTQVARGQQAPRPAHAPGTVSPPPQNEATFRAKRGEDGGQEKDSEADERSPVTNETRHCFNRYMQYHKCIEKNGRDANDCNNLRDYVRSMCPKELVETWEEQRKSVIESGNLINVRFLVRES